MSKLQYLSAQRNSTFSAIKRWKEVKNYRIFVKGEDQRNVTHLLMDNGKVHIPDELMDWFYKRYATDIFSHQTNFISECKTPIFKMIMDLDFYDDEKKEYSEFRVVLETIQGVIEEFYPDLSPFAKRMLVCMTEVTEGSVKNNKIFVKQGLGHLIWPDLLITNRIGMKIRQACLEKLEKQFGRRHPDNIWEDVVDKTIYKKNGLRMLGSAKLGICKKCKPKRGAVREGKRKGKAPDDLVDCDVCYGEVKYNAGRIYDVCDVLINREEKMCSDQEEL